ncbi:MAG: diguanylate cyclase [candidate division Zixibacteria bacterium]|nr:diguanylate cyclase [candidate division Zixibacteria bacterium]
MNNFTEVDTFLNQAGIELKRAERYRVFISLIVIDLSFTNELFGEQAREMKEKIIEVAQQNVRGSDLLSRVGDDKLVLLFPETSRQGAEVTSKRLSEIIRNRLSMLSERRVDNIIHLEMSSFPDTAGAKTVSAFLEELAKRSRN